MKYLISLIIMLHAVSYANANGSCGEGPSKGSECEIVRTYTRCDIEKQKLRHRINELEKEVEELHRAIYYKQEIYIQKEVVEKTVIKHHIFSLYATKDISDLSATQSGNTVTATVQTQYEPGIKYQYQFNFGLVPEIGINIKGDPEFGLGFEF